MRTIADNGGHIPCRPQPDTWDSASHLYEIPIALRPNPLSKSYATTGTSVNVPLLARLRSAAATWRAISGARRGASVTPQEAPRPKVAAGSLGDHHAGPCHAGHRSRVFLCFRWLRLRLRPALRRVR